MTETPHSAYVTTPMMELDDHRLQPESLPRVEGRHSSSRRGSLNSVHHERPDPAQIAAMMDQGTIARDFEQAIVDDDRSIRSGIEVPRTSHRHGASGSPIAPRRSTFRRPLNSRPEVLLSRSRDTSSSRSTSPPNSVDAFAAPRGRRRAGTAASQAPSYLSVERANSVGTHTRGRADTRSQYVPTEDARSHHSAEADVCFPGLDEGAKTYMIDFEELEEFVAEFHKKTPVSHPFACRNVPKQCHRIFEDLRNASKGELTPCDSASYPDPADEKRGDKIQMEKVADSSESDGLDLMRPASRAENANRWTFFSSEIDEVIHAAELGGLLMPGESFRDLFELRPEGGVWWLDMLNPSEEEVVAICKAFGVHPLTREDITAQETREKVELFHSYYFVCFRSFYQEDKTSEDFMEPINVYAVVFREGLLTFSFCPNPHAKNVRKRIGRLRDYVNLSADWICYAFIDEIVDAFGPVLRDVEIETDAIEDNVFVARFEDSRTILKQIGDCRKKVMSLLRLLGGKADVIKGFAKRCNEQYSVAPRGDVGLYLSDVQDHVVTMMSNLAHFEKMLSRSHANYLAQISVDNITQGNKANALLGKVTVIATILVPLNLIAGLFGMNVPVPGKNAEGLGWFFGIVGVILSATLACVIVARRMKMI